MNHGSAHHYHPWCSAVPQNVCKVGVMPDDCRIERTVCWCLSGASEMLWGRNWWLSRKNCYGIWNLGPLSPVRNQEIEQGMAPYPLNKTEKIPHTTICGKGYAGPLLGWTRGNFGALHAQEEHYDQCNVCRSPKEWPASYNQVHMEAVQVFCNNMTMLGPILPVQLLQQSKICPSSVFHICWTRQTSPPVTSTSLDCSEMQWEASLSGPTKRCSRPCISRCPLSQKNFLLEVSMHLNCWNTCMESNGDYREK